jgi:hypothetical protein
MYPQELFDIQIKSYKPGNENAAEHHRNGAFHWWIAANPKEKQLVKLILLTLRDPDQLMAADIRKHIARIPNLPQNLVELVTAYKSVDEKLKS